MRGGNAVEAPFGGVENGSCSEEDERALGMIERLYPAEYRAAKGEVAAAIASDAPASLGGLAAILSPTARCLRIGSARGCARTWRR